MITFWVIFEECFMKSGERQLFLEVPIINPYTVRIIGQQLLSHLTLDPGVLYAIIPGLTMSWLGAIHKGRQAEIGIFRPIPRSPVCPV